MHSIVTVTAQAVSVDLTILATLKAELNVTDNSENEALELYIDQASAACAAYCNRTFAQQSYKQTFRSRDRICVPELTLAHNPVTAIASVVLDGETLTVTDDYEWDKETGNLYRISGGSLIDWQFTTLVVNFTAGYLLLGELPMNVEKACLALAKGYRSSAQRDPLVSSESVPGVLDTKYWVGTQPGSVGNIPPDIAGLLDPFREIGV